MIYPFDVKDTQIAPLTTDNTTTQTYGTDVDVMAVQMVTLDEEEGDTTDLHGDGIVVAQARNAGVGTWELRMGALDLPTIKTIYDNTYAVTGTAGTSTEVRTMTPKNSGQAIPYFRIQAQAINIDGGDTKLIVYKCKAAQRQTPTITLEESAFAPVTVNGTYYWTNNTTTPQLWSVIERATAGASALV